MYTYIYIYIHGERNRGREQERWIQSSVIVYAFRCVFCGIFVMCSFGVRMVCCRVVVDLHIVFVWFLYCFRVGVHIVFV